LALAISEVKCAILNKIAKNVSFGNTFLKNCGFKTLKKKWSIFKLEASGYVFKNARF
jgi:hypothetical protein